MTSSGVMGNPEPDEQATDVMGGAEPDEQETDVLDGSDREQHGEGPWVVPNPRGPST